jgi:hypothetical protein
MASASIRPPKPESMPARFNYPSLPGNPDSTQPKSALSLDSWLVRQNDIQHCGVDFYVLTTAWFNSYPEVVDFTLPQTPGGSGG